MKKCIAIATSRFDPALKSKPTSIFVAAKSDFSIEGLLRILSDNTENEIVACVEPSESCWDKMRDLQPEILLLDQQAIILPKYEFFARIKIVVPNVAIIVFGQNMDDTALLNLVRTGASGYINENMNGQHLLQAIREVKMGRLWVERRILESLAKDAIDLQRTMEDTILERISAVREILTKRETAVYQLVLDGLATKEIAEKMHLSEQSVKLYLSQIFKKFQVTNRSQLILQTFARICPVSNVYRLIRMTLDKNRINNGKPPLIKDPLEDDSSSAT